MIVIGLMSGTSADGIDAAVVSVDGAPPALHWRLLTHVHQPYAPELRAEILACCRPESSDVARLCRLSFTLGRAFADAALRATAAAGITSEQVDLIGSHGQTVWHAPPLVPDDQGACTLQLGEAAVIAERTGITTISNFRARDVAAGGHGAPLVAHVDRLLFTHPTLARACQNLGGIANVTYLPPARAGEGDARLAFDTGPGNMLIDDAAARATTGAWTYDVDGALAARGRVDDELLAELLLHPYFLHPPPKTTGRELFGEQMGARIWEQGMRRGLRGEDVVATLTGLTARSIARAYRDFLPAFPREVIVSGGGARNATLMAMLRQALADAHPEQPPHVLASDELGLPVEAKEAVAFAVLAYETWHGRPGNDPAATGARSPVVLGDVTPGRFRPIAPPLPVPIPHAEGEPPPGERASGLPVTETRNPASEHIDALSTAEMVRLMNEEDSRVAGAVAEALPAVAQSVDLITERMRQGGRLIYVGAGTSGRLGALDAAEAPPTFGVPRGVVIALQAGGAQALTQAMEGAEDDAGAGARDIAGLNVTALDSVIGIAASGRTPYVLGALAEAKQRGALTVGLACVRPSALETLSDLTIAPVVGPEVITGSTRLKAGTAQKMVLNMLSTGVMIRLGKTYGNLMVDVQPTNAKLHERARRIVLQACESAGVEVSDGDAAAALEAAGGEVKTAIVSLSLEVTADEARRRLSDANGSVRATLGPRSSVSIEPISLHPTLARSLLLGVDAGGSKTLALVADAAGHVLGRGLAGSANYQSVGFPVASLELSRAITLALGNAGVTQEWVVAAVLGLAGVDRPEDRALYLEWATGFLPAAAVQIVNDAALVLAAGTPEGWGLALICGTGSIAVGRAPDGRSARSGGWGPLLGDEGSGYALGRAALQAVMRAHDGRGPRTVLTWSMLSAWRLPSPDALVRRVYREAIGLAEIAALAPLVDEAAAGGDETALAITRAAGGELALALWAVARRLGLPAPVPSALAGGAIIRGRMIRDALLRAAPAYGLALEPVNLVAEPALGAIRLARRLHEGSSAGIMRFEDR